MIIKKVLIIGGNGFIGTNLGHYLARKGLQVTSFDIAKPEKADENIEYIEGSFFDDDIIKQIIAGRDVIIQAVSTINPGNSNERYLQGYSGDFMQTVKLCSWLIGQQTKLIFLSSGGTVYGNQEIQPISEMVLPKPINHYGSVKLCIENALRTFNIQFKTNTVIARLSNPYGPGQDYQKGVGFVDAALKKAISGETIEIWGDGENTRDYIHIDDVCHLLYGLMNYQGSKDTFNISSNEGITLNRIIEFLKQLELPVRVVYKPARGVDCHKIILDNSEIKSVCNHQLMDFQEGLKSYYEFLMKEKVK